MPGVRPAGFAVSLMVTGVAALLGVKVSQLKLVGVAVTVTGSAEPSDATIVTVPAAGAAVLARVKK